MDIHAIGVTEVNYYANAVVVADAMLKASDIELISCHKKLGGRMVHTVVTGHTSAVQAAIEAAKQSEDTVGSGNVKVAITISNPHPEVIRLMNMLEQKIQSAEKEQTDGRGKNDTGKRAGGKKYAGARND